MSSHTDEPSELRPSSPVGYRWWQWVPGVFFFPVLILMIIGVSSRRLRPKLSYGRIWTYAAVLTFLFMTCTVFLTILVDEPASSSAVTPTSTSLLPSDANATHVARRIERQKSSGTPYATTDPKLGLTVTARRSAAPIREGPCRDETPATEEWFDEYIKSYVLLKALFEAIVDDLDPAGSYFHYDSIAEVKDTVDFRAERMMELAGDMSASDPPSNVPIRVKYQKDHIAAAYDEFARLILYKFDGDILGTSVTQDDFARAAQKFIDSETHSHPIILRVANADVNCGAL